MLTSVRVTNLERPSVLATCSSKLFQIRCVLWHKFIHMAVKELIIVNVLAPLCLLFWAGTTSFARLGIGGKGFDNVTPGRWFFSLSVPIFVALSGLEKKSVSISGAITGVIIGFILTFANYSFFACLLVFFITSSKATKFKAEKKEKLEQDFKVGGQRNWIQVLCNSIVATQYAVFYLLDSGPQEQPIDFVNYFTTSWLSLGILGAFACANGDTWASELGTVLTSASPVLVTTGQIVPKGTNGGVTVVGLLMSAAGGFAVGCGYYLSELACIHPEIIRKAPPQWQIVIVGAISGLIGSLFDSYLGAKFQYSGVDEKSGLIVEQPGPGVTDVCGQPVLDNHSVNLLSCLFTAVITPNIAQLLM